MAIDKPDLDNQTSEIGLQTDTKHFRSKIYAEAVRTRFTCINDFATSAESGRSKCSMRMPNA